MMGTAFPAEASLARRAPPLDASFLENVVSDIVTLSSVIYITNSRIEDGIEK